uniref:RING-type domain-containing protein n=1 Tax=Araucaria cunninghamii TaxID=56994 RepID=A0A0D6QT23_ARACU
MGRYAYLEFVSKLGFPISTIIISAVIAIGIVIPLALLVSYCIRFHWHGRIVSGWRDGAHVAIGLDELVINGARDESAIQGLHQEIIDGYPRMKFSGSNSLPRPQDAVCSVCLADYKEGETLRVIPDCRHVFHINCVDTWLRQSATCPICRTSPLPSPQRSPMSSSPFMFTEFVALAQGHHREARA